MDMPKHMIAWPDARLHLVEQINTSESFCFSTIVTTITTAQRRAMCDQNVNCSGNLGPLVTQSFAPTQVECPIVEFRLVWGSVDCQSTHRHRTILQIMASSL